MTVWGLGFQGSLSRILHSTWRSRLRAPCCGAGIEIASIFGGADSAPRMHRHRVHLERAPVYMTIRWV